MIDIHTHLLPAIDDGAGSLAEALAMCRHAAAEGCEALVATPHQRTDAWPNLDRPLLEARFAELQRAVGEEPRLFLGAEIRIDETLLADLEGPPERRPIPLAGSRYLLVELQRSGANPDPEAVVQGLVAAGWRPIFAHPEFISDLAEDVELAGRLAAAGAYFQVTAMSVTGEFGATARRRVGEYLNAGLVHFVASDAHGRTWRPTGLGRAREALAATWGEETADRLTAANPRAVLEDRPLPRLRQPSARARR